MASSIDSALVQCGVRQSPGLVAAGLMALALLIRKMVSFHPYSGHGTPPMYGDFEAQRHWMEITANLPASQWYTHGPDNDLQYWGLDYPPLTAYHSWLCGKIGTWVDPAMMALHSSRGIESPSSKLFMRSTVLAADVCVLLPALYAFVRTFYRAESPERQASWLLVLLLQPALILIDHGHFQFNGIALGLVTGAVAAAAAGRHYRAAFLFCLALMYKQMALYFALPFFFYLLGTALRRPTLALKARMVACLGGIVVLTLLLHWLPWLHSPTAATQVLHRIFPFNRGIYEDKVANFWGASSLLIKWNAILSQPQLVLLSTSATLLASLLACAPLLWRPTMAAFLRGLGAAGLSFFLFSFQVHEKTILFALVPLTLMAPQEGAQGAVCHLVLVSCFSMFPLLHRDGLDLPYLCLSVLFWAVTRAHQSTQGLGLWATRGSWAGMAAIHCLHALWSPPAKYPDLVTYMFVCFSAVHFVAAWGLLTYRQLATPEERPHQD